VGSNPTATARWIRHRASRAARSVRRAPGDRGPSSLPGSSSGPSRRRNHRRWIRPRCTIAIVIAAVGELAPRFENTCTRCDFMVCSAPAPARSGPSRRSIAPVHQTAVRSSGCWLRRQTDVSGVALNGPDAAEPSTVSYMRLRPITATGPHSRHKVCVRPTCYVLDQSSQVVAPIE
jgi:hypothetical protein